MKRTKKQLAARSQIIREAELAERWLTKADEAERQGNQGYGLCLRSCVRLNAETAFALARIS